MGFRFRKSFSAGPVRATISKSGVSYSVGGKHTRLTQTADGRTRASAHVGPVGYSETISGKSGGNKKASSLEDLHYGDYTDNSAYVEDLVAAMEQERANRQPSGPSGTQPEDPKPNKWAKAINVVRWIYGIAFIALGLSIIPHIAFVLMIASGLLLIPHKAVKNLWSKIGLTGKKKVIVFCVVFFVGILLAPKSQPEQTAPAIAVPETTEATEAPTTASTTAPTTAPTVQPTTDATTEATTAPTIETQAYVYTVYVPTNGGSKYHRLPDCSGMDDPREVPLDEAKAAGFTACKRCGPRS